MGVSGDRCGPWVGMLRALCAQTGGWQAAGVRIPGGQEDRGGNDGVLAGSKQHRNTSSTITTQSSRSWEGRQLPLPLACTLGH